MKGNRFESSSYYLPDDIWENLEGLIMKYPAMNVTFTGEYDQYGRSIHASLENLKHKNEEIFLYHQKDPIANGIQQDEVEWTKKIRLDFSLPLDSKVQVEIQSWDQQILELIEGGAEDNSFIF